MAFIKQTHDFWYLFYCITICFKFFNYEHKYLRKCKTQCLLAQKGLNFNQKIKHHEPRTTPKIKILKKST